MPKSKSNEETKKKKASPKKKEEPETKPESEFIVVEAVQGAEPEIKLEPEFEPVEANESIVNSFLERMANEPPMDALAALREEEQLKAIEEATKKMEKAAKRRTFKPITLKITGEMLVHWHSMLDGMRESLLHRPGVTAAEKAVYSKLPINNDTALDYLLTLHDEEMGRDDATRRAMLVDDDTKEPDDALIKNLSRMNQRRQSMGSDNPKSLLHSNIPPILPKLGAIAENEGFTMGGQPMSEAEFFRMVASKKPQRPVKKGR